MQLVASDLVAQLECAFCRWEASLKAWKRFGNDLERDGEWRWKARERDHVKFALSARTYQLNRQKFCSDSHYYRVISLLYPFIRSFFSLRKLTWFSKEYKRKNRIARNRQASLPRSILNSIVSYSAPIRIQIEFSSINVKRDRLWRNSRKKRDPRNIYIQLVGGVIHFGFLLVSDYYLFVYLTEIAAYPILLYSGNFIENNVCVCVSWIHWSKFVI